MVHADLTEQQRQQKEVELQKLRENISSLRKDIDSTRSKHSSVSKALKKTEVAIGQRVKNLKQLNLQIDKQDKKLSNLYREKRQHEKDMARHREILGEQLRTAYMNGQQEYLRLLLNQQDPSAFSRVMVYYDYFNRARTDRIEQAFKTIQQLDLVKEQITRQQAALKKLQEKELAEKAELEKSYQSRAKVVTQLRKELTNKDHHLQQLLENEKQISKLLQAIREVMPELLKVPDEAKPFARLKGSLHWPAAGDIRNLFGMSRSAGRLTWNGILINAPQGRDVYAVARGRVAYAEWLRGYGLLMIIDHGDGYMSLYGHNQSLYKETGDWVEAGEVVASIGNSGGQQQSALYFEIRHNGKPTNPAKWCRKKRPS